MTRAAPGKHCRKDLILIDLFKMFPDEDSATEWFEKSIWGDERRCPKCNSTNTCEATHPHMPYWCSSCRSYFSVKTGTSMQGSKIPLQKWAIGICLCLTSLKSVSSMKLHRDLGISQKTAWFMLQRIKEAWVQDLAVGIKHMDKQAMAYTNDAI